MIVKPILIIGAPRSGTSMLQKILRNHPDFWSLPSESDMIWDTYCHPRLHKWDSEHLTEADITPSIIDDIVRQFETFIRPASFWKPVETTNVIWGFHRHQALRKIFKTIYRYAFPVTGIFFSRKKPKRLVEKTASNCFRLGYVNEVFPDSKIIYPTRDGRNNVNSIINGWLHPDRFYTYDVPENLSIKDYAFEKWKFVLPPGWRNYIHRPLEEVCAFQWRSCHEFLMNEMEKSKYVNRVMQIKLEDLSSNSEYWLRKISEFVEVPYDEYFQSIAENLPVVNSPDNDTSRDKWKHQHKEKIERILPMITPMMIKLGYQV